MGMRAFIHSELRQTIPRLPLADIIRLKEQGYYSVSRAHCIVSRIDRPDWRRHMQERTGSSDLGPDYYRRCLSKDTRTLHPDDHALFETSPNYGEYVVDPGESGCCSLCGQPLPEPQL